MIHHRSVKLFSLLLTTTIVIHVVKAEVSTCRYDDKACSCRYGGDRKGICWDVIDDEDNSVNSTCRSRYCQAGWTCSCGGRTHECSIHGYKALTVDSFLDGTNRTKAYCSSKTVTSARGPSVKLGGWNVTLSRTGMLRNTCGRLTWYHNGNEIADFDTVSRSVTTLNVDSEISKRSVNTLYPFRHGDLLAFRLRNASYHCLLSEFALSVNGTVRHVNNTDSGDVVRFARRYSTGWNQPWFVAHDAEDELLAEAWKFFPLRKKFSSTGVPIEPGVDYWREEAGSRDHEVTNFYFRVQL